MILLFAVLSTGCSTLGFGDFIKENVEVKTDKEEKLDESISGDIPTKFSYHPLSSDKHEVYLSGDFNVLASALNGKTRMRVVLNDNRNPYPCGYYQSGEVEDYTVNISDSNPSVTTSAININSDLPILAKSQNTDVKVFFDAANLWGADYINERIFQ